MDRRLAKQQLGDEGCTRHNRANVRTCEHANAQREIRGRLRKGRYDDKRAKAEPRKGRYDGECAKADAMVVRETATGDLRRVICERESAKVNLRRGRVLKTRDGRRIKCRLGL